MSFSWDSLHSASFSAFWTPPASPVCRNWVTLMSYYFHHIAHVELFPHLLAPKIGMFSGLFCQRGRSQPPPARLACLSRSVCGNAAVISGQQRSLVQSDTQPKRHVFFKYINIKLTGCIIWAAEVNVTITEWRQWWYYAVRQYLIHINEDSNIRKCQKMPNCHIVVY